MMEGHPQANDPPVGEDAAVPRQPHQHRAHQDQQKAKGGQQAPPPPAAEERTFHDEEEGGPNDSRVGDNAIGENDDGYQDGVVPTAGPLHKDEDKDVEAANRGRMTGLLLASASQLSDAAILSASSSSLPAVEAQDGHDVLLTPAEKRQGRRRSSFSRKGSSASERRRLSRTIAAERRAEAKKAAAGAAAGAGAGAGAGLINANVSNHSTSSLHQEGGTASAGAGAALSSSEPSQGSTPPQSGSGNGPGPGPVAAPQRKAIAKVDSKRGLSVESQQPTVATSATTEVGDSVATNGSSGAAQKGNNDPDSGGGGGGKDNDDGTDKDGAVAVDGVAMSEDGSAAPSSIIGLDSAALPVKVDSQTVLQRTCLNPSYSLRNQLYLSFGTVSAVAILFVVITAIITTTLSGNQVKQVS